MHSRTRGAQPHSHRPREHITGHARHAASRQQPQSAHRARRLYQPAHKLYSEEPPEDDSHSGGSHPAAEAAPVGAQAHIDHTNGQQTEAIYAPDAAAIHHEYRRAC
jgi:hypothetical protein